MKCLLMLFAKMMLNGYVQAKRGLSIVISTKKSAVTYIYDIYKLQINLYNVSEM